MGTADILPGPYRMPAYAYDALAVATNKPPLGAYRGVGMTMGVFAMERTLDLLRRARSASIPPRSAAATSSRASDYPFTSAAGFVYDSGDFPDGARRRARRWPGTRDAARGSRRAARGHGRLVGVGIACYTESTGIGARDLSRAGAWWTCRAHEAATVAMDRGRQRASARVSFPSQGQGHATTVAQLVADRLGVPLERCRLRPARHRRRRRAGTGTFASRGAIAQSGAVDGAAATRARARSLALAASGSRRAPPISC